MKSSALSELFREKGDFKTALIMVQMALNNIKDKSESDEITYFISKCELELMMNQEDLILDELKSLLLDKRKTFIYNPIMEAEFKNLIKVCKLNKQRLIKLDKILLDIMTWEGNGNYKSFTDFIKSVYCEILIQSSVFEAI